MAKKMDFTIQFLLKFAGIFILLFSGANICFAHTTSGLIIVENNTPYKLDWLDGYNVNGDTMIRLSNEYINSDTKETLKVYSSDLNDSNYGVNIVNTQDNAVIDNAFIKIPALTGSASVVNNATGNNHFVVRYRLYHSIYNNSSCHANLSGREFFDSNNLHASSDEEIIRIDYCKNKKGVFCSSSQSYDCGFH